MARIYAPNESHNCDYGVDFYNGAAAVPDANTALVAWFTAKGYTVVPAVDVLSPWDYLKTEELAALAPYVGVAPIGMTKAALVSAIEGQLLLMKVEITAFDAIGDVDAGTVAAPTYADAAAVKAVLPTTVLCDAGTVGVPVAAWEDTDTYDKTTAGSYTFTATLGTLPAPYANTGSFTATIEVVVAA
jgi:hypothetical protein